MASHISPAASLRARARRRALLAAVLLAAPLAAHTLYNAPSATHRAPVYVWRDAGRVVHFSNP